MMAGLIGLETSSQSQPELMRIGIDLTALDVPPDLKPLLQEWDV